MPEDDSGSPSPARPAITEPVREAIRQATDWIGTIDVDGDLREHAEVCEITGRFTAAGFPDGTWFLVRRERPHPGAQLSLFDTIEGWRHQVIATDTPPGHGSIQYLEARHRGTRQSRRPHPHG